jgi:hypothetical protein
MSKLKVTPTSGGAKTILLGWWAEDTSSAAEDTKRAYGGLHMNLCRGRPTHPHDDNRWIGVLLLQHEQ